MTNFIRWRKGTASFQLLLFLYNHATTYHKAYTIILVQKQEINSLSITTIMKVVLKKDYNTLTCFLPLLLITITVIVFNIENRRKCKNIF